MIDEYTPKSLQCLCGHHLLQHGELMQACYAQVENSLCLCESFVSVKDYEDAYKWALSEDVQQLYNDYIYE
jgi:hypothetical protein